MLVDYHEWVMSPARPGRNPRDRPLASVAVLRLLAVLLALALVAAGCGGSRRDTTASRDSQQPVLGQRGDEKPAGPPLGFPIVATKNTTRVAGADPVADAAAVARAVFPARTQESRPEAVVLVDRAD